VNQTDPTNSLSQTILHICKRELLRPLRDQILRLSGYCVDSACAADEALSRLAERPYSLVLIDVEGEQGVADAEKLCSQVKTARPETLVAFVCNWRVSFLTDCPDEIVRTEFDPVSFVAGVQHIFSTHPEIDCRT
jgi:DNA-binding response OmpR family regulator